MFFKIKQQIISSKSTLYLWIFTNFVVVKSIEIRFLNKTIFITIMKYLSNDKLVIVGAGGMIGSNMVQSALMLGLTPNICLYDIFEPGVHGVYDEMAQCAFPGANLCYTTDPEKGFHRR